MSVPLSVQLIASVFRELLLTWLKLRALPCKPVHPCGRTLVGEAFTYWS